jgi:hypothetical protein
MPLHRKRTVRDVPVRGSKWTWAVYHCQVSVVTPNGKDRDICSLEQSAQSLYARKVIREIEIRPDPH